MNMNEQIEKIARKIAEGGKNIIFTGAGISTESGIPDYRSQGWIWDKYKPVYFNEFMSSKESRIEYWRRWQELYPDLIQAKPNSAHMALFKMAELGLIESVITQNIDGLHQVSGLPDEMIIELHGNTRRIRCMSCSNISKIEDIKKRLEGGDPAPECECGGFLKPDTISFGQAMPVKEVEKATRLSQNCDFMMVIGSTLLVQPAAHMPLYAKNSGAFLAIVNLSKTPCDEVCDALIHKKAGKALSEVVDEILKFKAL